jgi:predicted AAA+ superfamily ATPase
MIRQATHNELLKRLKEKRRFVQVLAGPRQVGKTIVVRQVMEASKKTYNSRSGKVAPIFG